MVTAFVYFTTKLADGVIFRSFAESLVEWMMPLNQPVTFFVSKPHRIGAPISSCCSASDVSGGSYSMIV